MGTGSLSGLDYHAGLLTEVSEQNNVQWRRIQEL